MSVDEIKKAGMSIIGAMIALRDAKRLLDIGFGVATEDAFNVLRADASSIDEAIDAVAVKEAADLVDFYEREPKEYPAGRTAHTALAQAKKLARSRYARGKCALCRGPALACAVRHAHGKSCA